MSEAPHIDTAAQKHLRIVHCAGCEALQAQVEQMAIDMHGLEVELKRYRRREQLLQREIAGKLKNDPSHEVAGRIFDFWVKQTGRTRRTIFDVAREKAILHALKLLEEAYGDLAPRALCAAIIGNARKGYVDDSGVRYTEIKMVCRDAAMIEKNIERYRLWMRELGREPVI